MFVYSPDGCNTQSWAILKPGSRNMVRVSPCECKDPNTWSIFPCFSRHTSRELNWKWSSQDSTVHVGSYREPLHPLCHNASPCGFVCNNHSLLIFLTPHLPSPALGNHCSDLKREYLKEALANTFGRKIRNCKDGVLIGFII